MAQGLITIRSRALHAKPFMRGQEAATGEFVERKSSLSPFVSLAVVAERRDAMAVSTCIGGLHIAACRPLSFSLSRTVDLVYK